MPGPFETEIMSVGVWNGIPFTLKDLEEMKANFEALREIIKPPIKLGHTKDETGQPAMGWVTSLRIAGSKLLATVSDIPDKLFNALKQRAYRRVSLEMFNNFEYKGKKYGRVLSALAFLGTELPAVKDLEDLQAYMTQNSGWTFEGMSFFSSDLNENTFSQKETEIMDLKELEAQMKAMQTQMATFQDENKALKDANDALKKDNEALKAAAQKKADEDAKKFKEDQKGDFKKFCDEQVKAGRMLPAQAKLFAEGDGAVIVFSDDNTASMITIAKFKEFVELGGKILEKKQHSFSNDPNEKGKVKGDANTQMDTLAKKYMTDHDDATYEDAVIAVMEANPELAQKFNDESISAVVDDDE